MKRIYLLHSHHRLNLKDKGKGIKDETSYLKDEGKGIKDKKASPSKFYPFAFILHPLFSRFQLFHRLAREGKVSDFIQWPLFFADARDDRFDFRIGHCAVSAEGFELAVVGMLGDVERLG